MGDMAQKTGKEALVKRSFMFWVNWLTLPISGTDQPTFWSKRDNVISTT